MKNLERAKLDSYDRIRQFNTKHATDLATITDYAGEQTKFNNFLASLLTAANIQQDDTSGNTPTSNSTKTNMAKTVIKFAKRGAVKARLAGNMVLAAELDESITYILKAPKTIAVQRATEMRNTMNSNLSTLTTITAANITQIDTTIAAYDGVKDNPTIARQVKKANGTNVLAPNYGLIDATVENMYDLAYSYFEDTKPAMIDEFALAKQILNTGIRHTSVDFTVTDEFGNIISKSTAKDMKNGKVYGADDEGNISVPKHKAGHFHFTISAPGYADIDLGLDVKQGMSNEFSVKMKKSV
jgi:hypothetical protein